MSQLEGHKTIEQKYEFPAMNKEILQSFSSYENTDYMDVRDGLMIYGLSGEHDASLISLDIQRPMVPYPVRLLQWTAGETTPRKFHEKFFYRRCHTKPLIDARSWL